MKLDRIVCWPDLPACAKRFMLRNEYIPKFRQFTREDVDELRKLGIINGCGGKGGRVRPPQFKFRASCDQHDWNYYLGGQESDRLKADRQFLKAMVSDVYKLAWYRWPFHLLAAIMFYRAVRRFGSRFFDYWEV